MALKVVARGKWKNVEIDGNLLPEKDIGNLICIQELTDYEIVDTKASQKHKKGKKRKSSETGLVDTEDLVQSVTLVQSKRKKKRKKKVKVAWKNEELVKDESVATTKTINVVDTETVGTADTVDTIVGPRQKKRKLCDMSAWNDLFVPSAVLKCLQELEFTSPTPIQALCLPPAIRDRLDIVGAAETGSGKTLAFAIPLIHHILQDKQSDTYCEDVVDDVEVAGQEESEEEGEDEERVKEEKEDMEGDSDTVAPEQVFNAIKTDSSLARRQQMLSPLYGLILTPTRELAMQIRDHIEAITKYTDITCCVLVGGMSIQKQTRLLRRCPDVIVATPGRLWQLIQLGNEHLSQAVNVRYLVIDEADRMVEKGHFHELTNLLNLINSAAQKQQQQQRQTFVFSATLTFVPTKPQRLEFAKKKKQKNAHQITAKEKLEMLMYHVGISEKAKLIDVGTKQRTTQTLTEARISCTVQDKDFYLFYILRQFPGRALVFANSKDCVRRLISIFSLLNCAPLALHADMQQRQRLKNLERFKANYNGLLVATDVAARGLDIPNVQHVIHYQVPRTTESYVHRSGRTARATKEGLSVMFVSPDDLHNYRKIIKALNRDDDVPVFPVDVQCFSTLKPCVTLARLIDKDQHRCNKVSANKRWIQQLANELDIEVDDDQLSDDGRESQQNAALQRKLHVLKQRLAAMLKQPILGQCYSGKYPTRTGKLMTSFVVGSVQGDSAIERIKQQQSKRPIGGQLTKRA